jgi:general stress protein 26
MASEPQSDKSEAELQDRAWGLAKSIGTCMFTTWTGKRQRSRPMTAFPNRDEHALYFLTEEDSDMVKQARDFPAVSAAFAEVSGNKYLVVSGQATVENDRAKIKELWSPFAKAFWKSPDDPAIRVVTLTPEDAELWDSPNRLVATAIMLTAAATGNQKPKLGDKAHVDM